MSTEKWRVRHPGIGTLTYDSEEEARVAAGTAGEVLAPAGLSQDGQPSSVPGEQAGINWPLLEDLRRKPHPLLRPADADPELPLGVGEVMQEAQAAHHLLDMAGVPHGVGYASDLDARTDLALVKILALRERLDRIGTWHARETGPGGLVGDFCTECGHIWPCDTRQMADGTYIDREEHDDDPS